MLENCGPVRRGHSQTRSLHTAGHVFYLFEKKYKLLTK
jgi:hypothetical protein